MRERVIEKKEVHRESVLEKEREKKKEREINTDIERKRER